MATGVSFMGTPANLRKAARSLLSYAEHLESGRIKWVDHTPEDYWTGCALFVNVDGQSRYVVPLSGRSATMLAMQRAITVIQEGVAPSYRLPVRGAVYHPDIITSWNDEQTSAQPVIAVLRLAADILEWWAVWVVAPGAVG